MIRRKPNMEPCQTPMAEQPLPQRLNNFDEVKLGYTSEEARREAERCLNCPDRYCAQYCPAHNYIPEFIAAIRDNDLEHAWELLARTNPLMEVSGRVCPFEKQCESHCTRGIKCEPVAIGSLERYVADWHRKTVKTEHTLPPAIDRSVAIVGAGPAGMTCALSLSDAGFEVHLYEKSASVGGVAGWGIPSFVLPKCVIENLTEQMKEQKVDIHLNTEVGKDITLEELKKGNDAVFIATGAELPVDLKIPGRGLAQVVQASDYLKAPDQYSGKNVLVIGGGNTAIDAARTALRRDAASVKMVYRRTEEDMPATKEELSIAREEGVGLVTLASPSSFLARDGKLAALECDRMKLTAPDYPGGRNNVAPSGEKFTIDCDLVILALGFRNLPVKGVKLDGSNRIPVTKEYETNLDGVYAGGDAVTGSATLMKAVAAGRYAAASIFSRLSI